jgi:quercetin dioxygenase-like cupin family protein
MIHESKRPSFVDNRGEITDIVENIPFNSLTMLTSNKGSVRGNHYHKETTQYTYIVEGTCRYYFQKPGSAVEQTIARKGDLIVSPPLESHALEALEDVVMLAFCQGPRAGSQYETDTFRLDKPLVRPQEGGSI